MSRLLAASVFVAVLTALVPAASAVAAGPSAPSPRENPGMAYDAARGQVVLFGGYDGTRFADTWTWDGTDWTQRTPAHSPPARYYHGMAYDAAHGQVVLFGGYRGDYLGDTWTWDGTDWTKHTPAHSPSPRLAGMGMAYDAARGQVVLFGEYDGAPLGDTWTWDGTDWTKHTPAHSPRPRYGLGMAYDAARAQVVLFGGHKRFGYVGDTWTWDGTDWTLQTPAHSPPARWGNGMAYDAARGQIVTFGGDGDAGFGDTWTWDGTDWTLHLAGSISLTGRSIPPGTVVQVWGWGFEARESVRLAFVDSTLGRTFLTRVRADAAGGFRSQITIPLDATPGRQRVKAKGLTSGEIAKDGFTVT